MCSAVKSGQGTFGAASFYLRDRDCVRCEEWKLEAKCNPGGGVIRAIVPTSDKELQALRPDYFETNYRSCSPTKCSELSQGEKQWYCRKAKKENVPVGELVTKACYVGCDTENLCA